MASVAGARCAFLSLSIGLSILETAGIFLNNHLYALQSHWQFPARKWPDCLELTAIYLTNHYKSISECATCTTLKHMGNSSRKPTSGDTSVS